MTAMMNRPLIIDIEPPGQKIASLLELATGLYRLYPHVQNLLRSEVQRGLYKEAATAIVVRTHLRLDGEAQPEFMSSM